MNKIDKREKWRHGKVFDVPFQLNYLVIIKLSLKLALKEVKNVKSCNSIKNVVKKFLFHCCKHYAKTRHRYSYGSWSCSSLGQSLSYFFSNNKVKAQHFHSTKRFTDDFVQWMTVMSFHEPIYKFILKNSISN